MPIIRATNCWVIGCLTLAITTLTGVASPTATGCQDAELPGEPTLNQVKGSELASLQRNISRLQDKLAKQKEAVSDTRKKLEALQTRRYGDKIISRSNATSLAIVDEISGFVAFMMVPHTCGIEFGDAVMFIRVDAKGNLVITGTGRVLDIHDDYFSVLIKTSAGLVYQPSPEDIVVDLERSDSPYSFIKCQPGIYELQQQKK